MATGDCSSLKTQLLSQNLDKLLRCAVKVLMLKCLNSYGWINQSQERDLTSFKYTSTPLLPEPKGRYIDKDSHAELRATPPMPRVCSRCPSVQVLMSCHERLISQKSWLPTEAGTEHQTLASPLVTGSSEAPYTCTEPWTFLGPLHTELGRTWQHCHFSSLDGILKENYTKDSRVQWRL